MHLVVDLMGSDSCPTLLYQGAVEASKLLKSSVRISVIGTQEALVACEKRNLKSTSIEFLIAKDEVLMGESPLLVVRRKQESSMAVGVRMLKNHQCDAFISAGNTGAITAYSSLELPKLPGILRPALLTELPTQKGRAAILDVGANVSFRADSFFQFALMGAAYQKIQRGVEKPKIGLLNIGAEVRKGTRKIRLAHEYFFERKQKMADCGLFFEGNIESRDFFRGAVDVLVTDGFTGNVFLKTCEGVSSFILDQVQAKFQESESSAKKAFFELEKYLDYAEYPGAMLIGVDRVVVKCHGSSSKMAMVNGIKGALSLVEDQVVKKIKLQLEEDRKRGL